MERTRITGLQKIYRSKAFLMFVIIVGLFILFSILAPLSNDGAKFFKLSTFVTILNDISVPAFLAIGAGLLMVSGAIDLSQARVGAFAGVIVAIGIQWYQMPWWLVIIIALIAAALIGLINALLVNELHFAPFIATTAMNSVVYALMFLLATDKTNTVNSTITIQNKGQGAVISKIATSAIKTPYGNIPYFIFLSLVAFAIFGLILSKTKFGRQLYLVGGNATAARLSGINSKRTSYFLFINASLLGGVAGVIYTAKTTQGSLLALATDQFTGLTAAILGGISFGGGSGGMGGAFLGLIVIKTFNKGMVISGFNTYLTTVLSGALLLLALTLDYFSQRSQQKRVGA